MFGTAGYGACCAATLCDLALPARRCVSLASFAGSGGGGAVGTAALGVLIGGLGFARLLRRGVRRVTFSSTTARAWCATEVGIVDTLQRQEWREYSA
jgi:hypothetical protein